MEVLSATKPDFDGMYTRAVESLTGGAEARRSLLEELLRHLTQKPLANDLQLRIVRLLWQLGCSNSGTEVRVAQPKETTAQSRHPGVLILGFAGVDR